MVPHGARTLTISTPDSSSFPTKEYTFPQCSPRAWEVMTMDGTGVTRSTSIHEDELLDVEQHVRQVGPGARSVVGLLGEEVQRLPDLVARRFTPIRDLIHRLDALAVAS